MLHLTAWAALVMTLLLLLSGPTVEAAPWSRDLAILAGCPGPQTPSSLVANPTFASGWSTTNAALTVNATKSPGCSFTAARLLDNATNGGHQLVEAYTATITAVQYTAALYVAPYTPSPTVRHLVLSIYNSGFTNRSQVYVDPASCTNSSGPFVTGFSTASVTYARVNGYCKVSLSFTATSTTALEFQPGTATTGDSNNYAGDGSGFYLWGACLAQGSTC